MKTYTVKAGDTLSKIAKTYGTTVQAIQAANADKIKDVHVIQIGWNLTIPNRSKDFEAIGRQLEIALRDVQNLPSVKKLCEMMEG
ncbi:LysM peptidoglycan-binding domain-containing protein [bacterium]|nr:LysM peptidoglycan-binding domain-containing protein [bacterium]